MDGEMFMIIFVDVHVFAFEISSVIVIFAILVTLEQNFIHYPAWVKIRRRRLTSPSRGSPTCRPGWWGSPLSASSSGRPPRPPVCKPAGKGSGTWANIPLILFYPSVADINVLFYPSLNSLSIIDIFLKELLLLWLKPHFHTVSIY